MYDTHSLAEWAQMVSLAFGIHGVFSVFWFVFVEAKPADFDPRPALARLVESGRVDALLLVVGPALVAVRESARDAAALIVLLTTRPKGAMA